ncbi:MAG: hypothetical protein ABEJ66_02055 [Candidatus Nanohaloarchaea archaeon]
MEKMNPGEGKEYLLQPFIPHKRGKRWMTYGGSVRTGMVRYPQGDYRTNVSTPENSTAMDALAAVEKGQIEPLQPSGQAGVRLAEDAAGELAERYADPELETPNIITSVDTMETSMDLLEGLPGSYLEHVERYSDDRALLVTEMESITGEMIDHMYTWEGPAEGIPALHEAVFLEEQAGHGPDAGDIAGDVEERIWNRVRASFPSRERMMARRIEQDFREMERKGSPPAFERGP